jgi:hypothetical protein
MITVLPTFKGYTVDARLGQFRKVFKSGAIEFLDFDSDKGDRLLVQYIKKIDVDSEEFRLISRAIV